MNELYKFLDREVAAVEQLAMSGCVKPSADKYEHRNLCCYASILQGRSELLLNSYLSIVQKATHYCSSEQIRASFNAQVKAFRSPKHNLLNFVVGDIDSINALGMTEPLDSEGVIAVFADLKDTCDIEKELCKRNKTLQCELDNQNKKIQESPFYQSSCKKCFQLRPAGSQTTLVYSNSVQETKARYMHLLQIAVNLESYAELLTIQFGGMLKRVMHASTEAEIKIAVNLELESMRSANRSLLHCYKMEVETVNALCMNEPMEISWMEAVYTDVEDACRIKDELDKRHKMLKQGLGPELVKIKESPFYKSAEYMISLPDSVSAKAQTSSNKGQATQQKPSQ